MKLGTTAPPVSVSLPALPETTPKPAEAIAHMVGYEDPAFFRRLFKRRTGVTPARYRRHFASILLQHPSR